MSDREIIIDMGLLGLQQRKEQGQAALGDIYKLVQSAQEGL